MIQCLFAVGTHIANTSHERYKCRFEPVVTEMISNDVPSLGNYGQWFYMNDGIIKHVQILDTVNDTVILNIQLITSNVVPKQYESWSQCVVDQFDINSAKVAFASRDSAPVFGENTLNDILSAKFQFTIRPCTSFKRCFNRIMKYVNKGFTLKCMSYDLQCSKEYREFIDRRFQHVYAGNLRSSTLMQFGIEHNIPDCTCDEHIDPYFDIHSPFREEMMFLDICYNQIKDISDTLRYFECSGLPIDMACYEHFFPTHKRIIAVIYIQRKYRMYIKSKAT